MSRLFDSLRSRVALVACLVVALGFILTGVALQGAAARQATERFDEELRDRLSTFVGGPGTGDDRNERPDRQPPGPLQELTAEDGSTELDGQNFGPIRQAAEQTLGRGYFLTVVTQRGVIATLGDAPSSDPPTSSDATIEEFVDADGRRWRVLTRLLPGDRGRVQLGGDVSAVVDETVAGFRRLVLILGSVATLATGLATAWAVSRATRPMARLAEVTQTVAGTQDLSVRVPSVDGPAEIREVADGLNGMLERLQQASESQATALHGARRFAADAGHELRTPLTAMQTTLDALVRNPGAPVEVRREGIAEVASETRRLAELLASLQLLARVDAGAAESPERLDLGDIVESAVAAAVVRVSDDPAAPTITMHGDTPTLDVRGLQPWIRSIVDNLLTNAVVHGRAGGTVSVHLTRAGEVARLIVEDDGPGIPADQRQVVFQRFSRGADSADRPGHGLGLSLVAQLAALHGGTVKIEESDLGGARLIVDLPLAASVR